MTRNLKAENLRESHYTTAIATLTRAREQFRSIERGEGQDECAVCGDNDHTAEQCWYQNPLLLATLGEYAIVGELVRCFHCGAVFVSQAEAERHFGKTPETPAECLRQLAAIASATGDE